MLIYNLLRKKLSNYIFKTCPIKGVRIIKDLSQSLLRLLIFLFNVFQRSWLFRWECEFNFETMNFRVSGIVYSSLLKLFSNQGRLTLAEHLKNWMKTLNLLNVYKYKNGFSGFENKQIIFWNLCDHFPNRETRGQCDQIWRNFDTLANFNIL